MTREEKDSILNLKKHFTSGEATGRIRSSTNEEKPRVKPSKESSEEKENSKSWSVFGRSDREEVETMNPRLERYDCGEGAYYHYWRRKCYPCKSGCLECTSRSKC